MTIKISITDPATTPRADLIAVLEYLANCAGMPKPGELEAKIAASTPQPIVVAPPEPESVIVPPAPPVVSLADVSDTTPIVIVPPAPPELKFGVEVDAAGLPWDGRIHAATRAKVATGMWRVKRGVSPELLTQVSAELRTAGSAGTPTPPPAPVIATIPTPPTEENTPAAPAAPTFPQFMQKVTEAYAGGAITQAQIGEAVASVGLPSLPSLHSRPDLIPQVALTLGIIL